MNNNIGANIQSGPAWRRQYMELPTEVRDVLEAMDTQKLNTDVSVVNDWVSQYRLIVNRVADTYPNCTEILNEHFRWMVGRLMDQNNLWYH